MENLPLIPGYTINDPTVKDFKLPQKFCFLNGFPTVRDSYIGKGGRPVDAASSAFASEHEISEYYYDPVLTYGESKEYNHCRFVPHYELFAQKCLNFKAYFQQKVNFNSTSEQVCVRYVNIYYFLEDDTMLVIEPQVENAGYQQGKLVRRGKVVKSEKKGIFYHWKDLNIGLDIVINGVVYHTFDCDSFTRKFLTSQGIDVGEREDLPRDPNTDFHLSQFEEKKLTHPQTVKDSRYRFLKYDGKILSFEASWNEDLYNIMYYLADDTIAVREIKKPNDGKGQILSNLLLRRTRVPKILPSGYSGIYLDTGDERIEYYSSKDFRVGETVTIFGRPFHLLNCDDFTRKYYADMYGIEQPPLQVHKTRVKSASVYPSYKPPPHIPFGTPEDTLASCLSVIPKRPKKDVMQQLLNFPKKLRYSMKMDAVHPEDEDRCFVLEYNLGDGTIIISELEKKNLGRQGGCFLSAKRVPKPGTDRDNPSYYSPEDFFIGSKINIFNHYFIIDGADIFVYRYIQENPEKFSQALHDNMRDHFRRSGMLPETTSEKAQESECVQLKDDESIAEVNKYLQTEIKNELNPDFVNTSLRK